MYVGYCIIYGFITQMSTFYIDSAYFDSKYLKNKLLDKKWTEASLEDKSITFIYLDGIKAFNKKTYNKKCVLKNDLKVSVKYHKDKWLFYQAMKERFPNADYMPETWEMFDFIRHAAEEKLAEEEEKAQKWRRRRKAAKPKKYYIIRPAAGRKGMGIQLAKSKYEVKTLADKFRPAVLIREAKNKRIYSFVAAKHYDAIVSRYIMKPMLLNKRVFHIRAYLILSVITGKFQAYMVKKGRMLTAAEPFDIKRADEKKIRDSHLDTTPTDYLFPDDLKLTKSQEADIMRQARLIMRQVSAVLEPTVSCYPGIDNCFGIYGVDFMISREYKRPKLMLIEINGTDSGFTSKTPDRHAFFTKMIFDIIFAKFICPTVYGKNSRSTGVWKL